MRLHDTERRGRECLAELRAASQRVDGLLQTEEAGRRDFGSFRSYFQEGLSLDGLLTDYMEGIESWGGVINRMNEAHFHRPIAESMLCGILSELASSFSASAIEHEYAIDSDGESIISTVVRDDGSSVVTRRVTRRRSVYGTGRDEG
jgi:hypothetical protein